MKRGGPEKRPEADCVCPGSPSCVALLADWEAARAHQDYETSDAIRETLRAMGINPGGQVRALEQREYESGFAGEKWAIEFRYNAAWGKRAQQLQMISSHAFLVSSAGWRESPKLRRYMTIPSSELRLRVALALGQRLRPILRTTVHTPDERAQLHQVRGGPGLAVCVGGGNRFFEGLGASLLCGRSGRDLGLVLGRLVL